MPPSDTISIDCHELTVDEQLALATAISDGLGGRAVALVKDSEVVLDALSGPDPDPSEVAAIVRRFISKRKDAQYYSLESEGDDLVVHSADPLVRGRGRKEAGLPDNLLKCPFCGFVTPYQELYNVHFRSHGFAVPL